jgi:polyphosphate kinase
MIVPGVKGLSENVVVANVVGRCLEHARIFHFRNGGAEEIWLSSADWMPRNLDKRVELLFPLLDEGVRAQAKDILAAYFADTAKGRRLLPSGRWARVEAPPGEAPFSAQERFYEMARLRRALEEEAPERELAVRRRPIQEG